MRALYRVPATNWPRDDEGKPLPPQNAVHLTNHNGFVWLLSAVPNNEWLDALGGQWRAGRWLDIWRMLTNAGATTLRDKIFEAEGLVEITDPLTGLQVTVYGRWKRGNIPLGALPLPPRTLSEPLVPVAFGGEESLHDQAETDEVVIGRKTLLDRIQARFRITRRRARRILRWWLRRHDIERGLTEDEMLALEDG